MNALLCNAVCWWQYRERFINAGEPRVFSMTPDLSKPIELSRTSKCAIHALCILLLASLQDGERLKARWRMLRDGTIYHAAVFAVMANTLLISIYKPLQPINVMGASKHLAEVTRQSLVRPIRCAMLSLIS